MPSHWECRCGERFGKYGFEFTGHIKDGKGRGEDHGIRGLVDDETGEVLAVSLPQAVKRGLVPSSSEKPRQSSQRRNLGRVLNGETSADISSEEPSEEDNGDHKAQSKGKRRAATTVRGKFYTQEVMLDGRLLLLYDLARQRFPEYDASVGEWIWDCIMHFYTEHADELGLGKLFEDSLKVEVESG